MKANRWMCRPGGGQFWPLVLLAGCLGAGLILLVWLGGRRGSGTLIVQADDPEMEVVIAGAGAVHKQKGSGEVNLPAGRYEVWCSGKGRTGPSLWVDVQAGQESEASPESPVSVRSGKPFAILAREDEPELGFDTLEQAIDALRAGDTLEIAGNGPFVSGPLRLDRAVIRAAPGFRPVIRLASAARGALLNATGALVLEGLELDARPGKQGPAGSRLALAGDGPLYLAFCRLRQEGNHHSISSNAKRIHLTNCFVHGGSYQGLHWTPPARGRLRLDGSLINGLLLDLSGPPRDASIDIDHCTLTASRNCFEVRYQRVPSAGVSPLRVRARNSVFAPSSEVLLVNLNRKEKLDADEAEASLGAVLNWREEGNVYADGLLLRHAVQFALVPRQKEVRTLADWKRAWRMATLDGQQGKILFAGKNSSDKSGGPPVSAFRLAKGSPGKAGRLDAGADVDQVGPGLPCDRWRKTQAYESWRRHSGQVPRFLDERKDRLRTSIESGRWEEVKTLLGESSEQLDQEELLSLAAQSCKLRAEALRKEGKHTQAKQAVQLARACYERLLDVRPDDTSAEGLAALLMPGVESIPWRQGLAANKVSAWTWLAVAYYTQGDGKASMSALEKAGLSAERSSIGVFLLALANQQRGQQKEARVWYDRGIEALKTQPSHALLELLAREAMRKVASLSEQKASDLLAECLRQGEEAVLSAAIKREPDKSEGYYVRGTWYARHGRWKSAAADMVQASRLAPTDNWIWYETAVLLAQAGDRDAHRKHCQEMVRTFAGASDPPIAERTAKASFLLPGTDEDRSVAAQLARRALKEGAKHEFRWYFEGSVALVEYREGKLADAEKRARKVLAESKGAWAVLAPPGIVLAMALHRLGKTVEAKTQLAQSAALLEKWVPTVEKSGGAWVDWVVCRLLLLEAEGVLARPPDKPKEGTPRPGS